MPTLFGVAIAPGLKSTTPVAVFIGNNKSGESVRQLKDLEPIVLLPVLLLKGTDSLTICLHYNLCHT